MKGLILGLMLITGYSSLFGQNAGIGIRVGEPSGISFKKYLPGARAFELTVGSTGYLYNRSVSQGTYITGGLSVAGNYLIHKSILPVRGLDGYYGAGAAVKLRSFRYNDEFVETSTTVTKFSASVNGVIGLEYIFDRAPVALFLDLQPYVEIMPYPLVVGIDGGFGIRYNF